ncbi:hypothetical protein HBI94_171460 [Parastagonospora nodorum]|nr:hypothetical protein HBI79_138260 [Parastagonospora nodorum]KAH5794752.1 hypothetical protein HBI96_183580 [Parastagonospora nodorum]KAH5807658.1 hypothetical protein HBI94_171460 [Parastagonospora nodorum]KAH5898929.1 hypothetical protein HBI89_166240 [Parastagonospora nodorum]KAH6293720.1 hypothetical protein HBI39_174320 [Parastagonospora nodorum]
MLPDLESALASLEPPADDPVPMRSGGRARRPSCGVVLEPMGVARRRAGGMGRDKLGWTSFVPLVTGLAFGEAGMERPRRGAVRPPPWERPPGTGGRRRGTAWDMLGGGLEVCSFAVVCICCSASHVRCLGCHSMVQQLSPGGVVMCGQRVPVGGVGAASM